MLEHLLWYPELQIAPQLHYQQFGRHLAFLPFHPCSSASGLTDPYPPISAPFSYR